MMRSTYSKKILEYSFYILAIILLYLYCLLLSIKVDNSLIVPSPNDVIIGFFASLTNGSTWQIIGNSFLRLLISLAISVSIGIVLGVLAGICKYIRYFLKPFITILRTTPLIAVIMIIMSLYGNIRSPYIIVSLMIIPIMYEGVLQGILNIDSELMDVWKIESSMNLMVIFRIILPCSFSYIKTGFIQSVGTAFKVLIMAEYLCLTKKSIGYAIRVSIENVDYLNVFAWCIIAIILVFVVEFIPKLIFKCIDLINKSKNERNVKE